MSATDLAQTRDDILQKLTQILVDQFELAPEDITPEAHLYDDLGIDSIDAVDLIVELRELTGRKLDPETFKELRTVADVVEAIDALLNRKGE